MALYHISIETFGEQVRIVRDPDPAKGLFSIENNGTTLRGAYIEAPGVDPEIREHLQMAENEHLIWIYTHQRSWSSIRKSIRHELCHMKLRRKNPIEYPEDMIIEELAVIHRTGLRVPVSSFIFGMAEILNDSFEMEPGEALSMVIYFSKKSKYKKVRRKAKRYDWIIRRDNL